MNTFASSASTWVGTRLSLWLLVQLYGLLVRETAAPLKPSLELLILTIALLFAAAIMCNIGYTDPSVFPPHEKIKGFFPFPLFSEGEDQPQGRF